MHEEMKWNETKLNNNNNMEKKYFSNSTNKFMKWQFSLLSSSLSIYLFILLAFHHREFVYIANITCITFSYNFDECVHCWPQLILCHIKQKEICEARLQQRNQICFFTFSSWIQRRKRKMTCLVCYLDLDSNTNSRTLDNSSNRKEISSHSDNLFAFGVSVKFNWHFEK